MTKVVDKYVHSDKKLHLHKYIFLRNTHNKLNDIGDAIIFQDSDSHANATLCGF